MLSRHFTQNHKCQPHGARGKNQAITKVNRMSANHECQNFVVIHQVDLDIFHWIVEKFDLLVVLEEKSGNCSQ